MQLPLVLGSKDIVKRVAVILGENPNLLYCLDPGRVVIINNEIFDGSSKVNLENRAGSKQDEDSLLKFFDDTLNWERPHVFKDKSVDEIKEIMSLYSTKMGYKDVNSFFLVILSHGNEDGIYGTDCRTIKTETILNYFSAERCPGLAFKPKIFIFQACRGDLKDCGVSIKTDSKGQNIPNLIRIPNMSDFLVAYPCVPGYTALRHEGKGSIYIQCLVRIFENYLWKDSLTELMLRLNHVISRSDNISANKMMPCQDIRMTKVCYFRKWFNRVLKKMDKNDTLATTSTEGSF